MTNILFRFEVLFIEDKEICLIDNSGDFFDFHMPKKYTFEND